jgi:DNA-binding CsgD family transcriptional regulator
VGRRRSPPHRPTALADLAALHEQSLVRRIAGPATAGGAEPRFGMLETIREYAADLLAASGEAEVVRDAHAAYFLALVDAVEPRLASSEPNGERRSRRIEAELANLRVAEATLRERGDEAAALRLTAAIEQALQTAEHQGLRSNPAAFPAGSDRTTPTEPTEPAASPASPDAAAAEPAVLTPREQGVLRLLVEGKSDREIADALAISRRTASNHVAAILAKLKAPSRTAAATRAVRDGLI